MAKADFDGAKNRFPVSTAFGEADWVAVFDSNPDVMWKILGDVYNVIRDQQERESGSRKMGRRPVRAAGSIDELLATVIPPQFTQDPFPVAFKALIGTRSQRQFAVKIPCDQSLVSRLLSGDVTPDLGMLERIAAAAKVPPHYFAEYRAAVVAQAVHDILTQRPNVSITAFKQLRGANRDVA